MKSGYLVIFYTLLVASFTVISTESQHQHGRVGIHGMALVTDGVELYASHLPLYRAPHDFQLVYLVKSVHKAQLIQRLTQPLTPKHQTHKPRYEQNMVTILPSKFDLNKLVEGQSFKIETQFFIGHFERGGQKWLSEENFEFVRQIYKRPLGNITTKRNLNKANWQVLNTPTDRGKLLIHTITSRPSFDAIVFGKNCPSAESFLTKIAKSVPTYEQLKRQFTVCKTNQVLYFETRDFAL